MSDEFIGLSQADLDMLLKAHKSEAAPDSRTEELKKKISEKLSISAERSKQIDESAATVRQEEVDALFREHEARKHSQTVLSRML